MDGRGEVELNRSRLVVGIPCAVDHESHSHALHERRECEQQERVVGSLQVMH